MNRDRSAAARLRLNHPATDQVSLRVVIPAPGTSARVHLGADPAVLVLVKHGRGPLCVGYAQHPVLWIQHREGRRPTESVERCQQAIVGVIGVGFDAAQGIDGLGNDLPLVMTIERAIAEAVRHSGSPPPVVILELSVSASAIVPESRATAMLVVGRVT